MAETGRRISSSSTLPACEACRKSKMRCIRSSAGESESGKAADPCERCRRNARNCIIPQPRPLGRRHGAVGKYRGLEKAVRKMRLELSKEDSRVRIASNEAESSIDLCVAPENQHISNKPASPVGLPGGDEAEASPSLDNDSFRASAEQLNVSNNHIGQPRHREETISNPLGLVADVSGEAQAKGEQSATGPPLSHSTTSSRGHAAETESSTLAHNLLGRPGYISLGLKLSRQSLETGLDALFSHPGLTARYSNYFKSTDSGKPPDTGPDVEPVELGLVTMEEAEYLFPIYFARLHPFNGILDPLLHTPNFVRSRSALLFTWILAITAQFDTASSPMAKRLRLHGENLSKHIHANGYRSVEIAQGYYISLLSATPANTMSDERSWMYTNYAFGIAAELVSDHRSRSNGHSARRTGPPSPLLSTLPRKSGPLQSASSQPLDLGLPTDPYHRQRMARNRERTWLRILLWERAHSSARGRMSSFPETELTLHIEDWSSHALAHPADKHTCAFIHFRRQLALLHDEIKRQIHVPHSDPHWVRELVDSALAQWHLAWLADPAAYTSPTGEASNVYMHYVYMHGRLWTLSFALQGSTNGGPDTAAMMEDCFDAAVECCEAAVRDLQEFGEPIYCMLAPTWAMISYAAVVALKLFPLLYGTRVGYKVELLALVSQVALQLEKAGTTPPHRFGISALLGQHLFLILRSMASGLKDGVATERDPANQEGPEPIISSATSHWGDVPCVGLDPLEHDGRDLEWTEQGRLVDTFMPIFDPFVPVTFQGADMSDEDLFGGMIREWYSQGFGGLM
ncbi:hypothetical protein GQ53DRAFT_723695 [Thozetella sp. PMI_491]|nr:hypothetical protein GQ53DRAFT_723695 [Thozetella sp. PMI_491]